MRRVFWISVGVGVTVYVLQKVNKASAVANHLTPAGIANAVNNLADSVREVSGEFRASMAEHEKNLTNALLSGRASAPSNREARHREPDFSEFAFDGDPEEYF